MTIERVLIAIGGNALYDKATGSNLDAAKVTTVCENVVAVLKAGYIPIITYGNGPQVGNLLNMSETATGEHGPPTTLDTCVAWTQGEIGFRLRAELSRQLRLNGLDALVMAVITTVEVDPKDPAFQNPSKPVGRFLDQAEAERLAQERGWVVGEDSNRGYRRRVPSPRPKRILELEATGRLIKNGVITFCCGGGGIPVWEQNGFLYGIEAVIDKDYTSCLLAKGLGIENLIICTEVETMYLNFGKPDQTPLRRVSLAEAERYLKAGHFAAGSMGPKVEALVDYLRHGGKRAFITNLENVTSALAGDRGTEIYVSEASCGPGERNESAS